MTTIKVETSNKAAAPALAVGQIWLEGDTRFERYVLIQQVDAKPGKAKITSCTKVGVPVGNTSSFAMHARFNNKRSGYLFVADKPA